MAKKLVRTMLSIISLVILLLMTGISDMDFSFKSILLLIAGVAVVGFNLLVIGGLKND